MYLHSLNTSQYAAVDKILLNIVETWIREGRFINSSFSAWIQSVIGIDQSALEWLMALRGRAHTRPAVAYTCDKKILKFDKHFDQFTLSVYRGQQIIWMHSKSWFWYIEIYLSPLVLLGIELTSDEIYYHDHTGVVMGAVAPQITSLVIVYSTLCSDTDQRKHQSSASLAFVWGIHRGPVNSPHKWPVTRNVFPFDDVIILCLLRCLWPWIVKPWSI